MPTVAKMRGAEFFAVTLGLAVAAWRVPVEATDPQLLLISSTASLFFLAAGVLALSPLAHPARETLPAAGLISAGVLLGTTAVVGTVAIGRDLTWAQTAVGIIVGGAFLLPHRVLSRRPWWALLGGLLFGGTLAALGLALQPGGIRIAGPFPRPVEFVPFVVLLVAIADQTRRAPRRLDPLSHWTMLALILLAGSHLLLARAAVPAAALAGGLAGLCFTVGQAGTLWRRGTESAGVVDRLHEAVDARIRAERGADRFFALTPDLLCIADFEGRFVEVNIAWTLALGYEQDALRGAAYIEHMHPEDRASTLAVVRRLIAGGSPVEGFECRFVARDGAIRWFRWSASGDPLERRLYAIGRDITEARAQATTIRESESRLRALLATAPDGIFTANTEGRILLANPAGERMFGYEPGALAGRHVADLLPAELRPEVEAWLQEAATWPSRTITGQGAKGLRRDGTVFPADLSVSTVPLDDRQVYIGIVRDVTARRTREQELHDARRAAEAADRVKSAFLATMSHELRTPLNSRPRGPSDHRTDASAWPCPARRTTPPRAGERCTGYFPDRSRTARNRTAAL